MKSRDQFDVPMGRVFGCARETIREGAGVKKWERYYACDEMF